MDGERWVDYGRGLSTAEEAVSSTIDQPRGRNGEATKNGRWFRVINGGLWGLMVVYSDYSKL
jgi:hypothetical protein